MDSVHVFQQAADRFFSHALEELGTVPGYSIAVVRGDEVVYVGGGGYADQGRKLPATGSTSFYIASSTKSFTGLMAAILHEEGVIDLDGTLADCFPDIAFDPEIKPAEIKIRQLLTHTSGIENSPIGFRVAYSGDHSFDVLKKLVQYCKPNRVGPGKFEYTNDGYNIYAVIVEQVTGKPWQEVLEDKVLHPLGLKRTTPYISKAEKNNWLMALPYAGIPGNGITELYLKKQDNTMQSAGGLISTAEDLARWLLFQINQGKLEGKQVIPESVIAQTHRPEAPETGVSNIFRGRSYGLGWHIGTYQDQKVLWHFGGFPGFFTHVSFLPEKELGVAIMVNDAVAGMRVMDLFAGFAYDWWLGKRDTEQLYGKQNLPELKNRLTEISGRILQDRENRAKREWKLSDPFEHYSGTYVNELFGTVQFKGYPDRLEAKMGNLQAVTTPYTARNTVRVEFVPGSGEVIEFVLKKGEVVGFNYSELFFEKAKSN